MGEISWFGLKPMHVFKCLKLLREVLYHHAKFVRNQFSGVVMYKE
jgi:hypothetical protein